MSPEGFYRRHRNGSGTMVFVKRNKGFHGMYGTPEYRSWIRMKARCYNKRNNRYKWYGGRGIRVCDRWLNSFTAFYEDMGKRPKGHSIDRKNGELDYSPTNCKWSTDQEQANNRSTNKVLTYKGVSLSTSDWARRVGLKPFTLHQRLRVYGWPVERAITTPARERKVSAWMTSLFCLQY